jgi:hypothetical protein
MKPQVCDYRRPQLAQKPDNQTSHNNGAWGGVYMTKEELADHLQISSSGGAC